ncbi:putative E3 ubiquitin-protein ligase TRIM71-like isoform X2 [Apostichopus japonicus]|uniref:Putative E3 ubiquitin-protein ligase TRIM71-like isoform X2 n=1 Tax=Stichopus japonicus TaxID=307972 RepID=A0A2G8KRG1_STIJA|nr:putative E3 ubiquitin-protein ligase TRIM71-like isoform X2 [Apostichopus japonicus]
MKTKATIWGFVNSVVDGTEGTTWITPKVTAQQLLAEALKEASTLIHLASPHQILSILDAVNRFRPSETADSSSSFSTSNKSHGLSNVNKPTPSASSKGTAGGGHGFSSSGSVTSSDSQHNALCQQNAYMSKQENAGARPKQYKATSKFKTSESSTKKSSKKGVIVKTMRDNLLCPICLDLLENAKTLPCQHVACKKCLEPWVASKGQLRCPTCNTRQKEPVGGVHGLPSNFMMNNLAAEMKKLDTQDEIETDFTFDYTSWQSIPVAETSYLEILGKQFKVKGSTAKVKLQFCDVQGQPIRGKSRDGITAFVIHPDGEKIPILDVAFRKRTGDYTVSFAAEQIGTHSVEVTLNGESVVGSPSKIVVRPNGIMDRTLSPTLHAPKGILATPDEIYVTDESDKVYVQTDWQDDWDGFGMDKPHHKEFTQISPFGIAKCNDKLLITDSYNNCIYVYVHMVCMTNFGKRVMEQPTGIAVSKDGTIYVADCASNTIDVFLPNYSHKRSIDAKGNGSLKHLALNQSEDRIIVADDKTNVIKIIDVNSEKVVKFIKTRISQALATPFGVALDHEDNIYVSVTFDPSKLTPKKGTAKHFRRKGAVMVYNSIGYFLGTIGEKELINPRGICLINDDDDSPRLLVVEGGDSESQFGCIKVFSL